LAVDGLGAEAAGVIWAQEALIGMRLGDIDLALTAFDAAIARLREPVHLGKAHGNRGNVYLQQRRTAEAASDFDAAARLLVEAGEDVSAAMCRHNLGYCLLQHGDLVGALREMDLARGVLAPISPVVAAVGDQDRAEVLLAAGLVEEGRDALRSAARAFASRGIRQSQGEAQLALASSLSVVDSAEARRLARAASRTFQRSGSPGWEARAEATALIADVQRGARTETLLESARTLANELSAQRLAPLALGLRAARAHLLVRLGRLDQARHELARIRVTRAPLNQRLAVREVRADLEAARGRDRAALRTLAAALDELHAWQSSFGSLDLQTNVVGHGVRLAVRGLSLAVQSRSDAVLFEWSERARMLASRIQPVRAPQDPQTAADLAQLRAGPPPAREAELRRRIREQAWQHKGSGEVTDPVSLTDMQAGLGENSALVAYVVTADRVAALVVTSTGTARHDLGDRSRLDDVLGGMLADLDMAAAELPASLAGSVRGTLARRLDVVASLLVAPLLGVLGDRRLVLTPSGVLAGVPWTLLPGLVGRPVTVAQSATSWLARSATPLHTGSAGFVAGPRVVRAEAEVRASAAAWDSAPVLAGDDATAGAVSGLAGRVDVLHVAAHGRHSAENPLFSGLELVDGTWFGYDIDQLPAVPDVVLLSACEVGRSSVRWGEELIGMTAAWLHAGARCVVASPAAVNDEAAHDVLVRVHEALAAGADPATALAETVSAVTTDAAPAPFLCFG
jgi:CHAT domain-containing protein/tetratricopeptide (TPR) repeat protein